MTCSGCARTLESSGKDQVLMGSETCFGLGFMLACDFSPFGGSGTFGHPGAGGSVGFADPRYRFEPAPATGETVDPS